jgi:hypothetical protein
MVSPGPGGGRIAKLAGLSLWPHRLAGVIAVFVVQDAAVHGRAHGFWATLPLALIPYLLLEGVGRIPATHRARLLFLGGSLCLSASVVLYAPRFSRHSGEWTPLVFLFVPALQVAGVVVLAVLLATLRLAERWWIPPRPSEPQ